MAVDTTSIALYIEHNDPSIGDKYDLMAGTHKPTAADSATSYQLSALDYGQVSTRNSVGRWETRILMVGDHLTNAEAALVSKGKNKLDNIGERSRRYDEDKHRGEYFWLYQKVHGSNILRAVIYNAYVRFVSEGDFSQFQRRNISNYELVIEHDEWESTAVRTVVNSSMGDGQYMEIAGGGTLPARISRIHFDFTSGTDGSGALAQIHCGIRPAYTPPHSFKLDVAPAGATLLNGSGSVEGGSLITIFSNNEMLPRVYYPLSVLGGTTGNLRGDYTVLLWHVNIGGEGVLQVDIDGIPSEETYLPANESHPYLHKLTPIADISLPAVADGGESFDIDDIVFQFSAQRISGTNGTIAGNGYYLIPSRHTLRTDSSIRLRANATDNTTVFTFPNGRTAQQNKRAGFVTYGAHEEFDFELPVIGGQLHAVFQKIDGRPNAVVFTVTVDIVDRWSSPHDAN